MDSQLILADAKKLAGLFSATGDESTLYQDTDLAIILRHQLNAPLAEELSQHLCDAKEPSASLGNLGPDFKTFGDLIHHPEPPVELLIRVKEFAKSCRSRPELLPPEVATLLYYAAITAARVRLHQSITELGDDGLKIGLQWAISQDWLDEKSRSLFRAGVDLLKDGKTGGNSV